MSADRGGGGGGGSGTPEIPKTDIKPDLSEGGIPIGTGVITPEMEKYRTIMAKNPVSRVFAALAELYRREGMLDEAIKLCLDGLTAHPSYMSGRVALGRAYFDKGMFKEARKELEKVVSVTPDNLVANKVLGDIHIKEGDFENARTCFKRVINISPDDEKVAEKLKTLEGKGVKKPVLEEEDIIEGDVLELLEEEPEKIDIEDMEVSEKEAPRSLDDIGDLVTKEPLHVPRGDDEIETTHKDETEFDKLDIIEDIEPLEIDDIVEEEIESDDEFLERDTPESKNSMEEEVLEFDFESDEDETTVVDGYEEESLEEPADTGLDIGDGDGIEDNLGIMNEAIPSDLEFETLPGDGEAPSVEEEPTQTNLIVGEEPREEPINEEDYQEDEETKSLISKEINITTETIADIYVKQGYFDKALEIYQELTAAYPGDKSLSKKLEDTRRRLNAVEGHDVTGVEKTLPIREPMAQDAQEGTDGGYVPGDIAKSDNLAEFDEGKRTIEFETEIQGEDDNVNKNIVTLNNWLLNIRRFKKI